MKNQFLTMRFLGEMLIAIAVAIILFVATRLYNPEVKEKDIKIDYFRIPTNNALVVIGLLVPILTGLAAYLYTNDPSAKYSLLLASIAVLFVVLIVAVWETFSLLGKAQTADIIRIKLPDDRKYITGMGLMYAFLILGLLYFALFFLFELSPAKRETTATTNSASAASLLKPRARIAQSKDELVKSWGAPTAQDSTGKTLTYESDQSEIRLVFDNEGKLMEIVEKRR